MAYENWLRRICYLFKVSIEQTMYTATVLMMTLIKSTASFGNKEVDIDS